MKKTDIHSRLRVLEAKLNKAEHALDIKGDLTAAHNASIAEMRERYDLLSENIANEVKNAEANGRHVTDLEQSLQLWLSNLDMDFS